MVDKVEVEPGAAAVLPSTPGVSILIICAGEAYIEERVEPDDSPWDPGSAQAAPVPRLRPPPLHSPFLPALFDVGPFLPAGGGGGLRVHGLPRHVAPAAGHRAGQAERRRARRQAARLPRVRQGRRVAPKFDDLLLRGARGRADGAHALGLSTVGRRKRLLYAPPCVMVCTTSNPCCCSRGETGRRERLSPCSTGHRLPSHTPLQRATPRPRR